MPEGTAVEVALTIPVRPESAENLAEVANALNEALVGTGLWIDLVHGPQSVYLVLLRVS